MYRLLFYAFSMNCTTFSVKLVNILIDFFKIYIFLALNLVTHNQCHHQNKLDNNLKASPVVIKQSNADLFTQPVKSNKIDGRYFSVLKANTACHI